MRDLRKFIFPLILFSVLLVGCAGGTPDRQEGQQGRTQPSEGEGKTIRLGLARGIPALQFFHMMEERQLQAKGYNVEWQVFDSPVALSQAFSSGQLDMAISTGITTAGQLADQGVPLLFVATVSYSTVGGIYSKQAFPVDDLKGKKVGLLPKGTQTTLLTELLLRKRYGLDPARDFDVTYVEAPQSYLLLTRDDLDAALNFSREAVLLSEEGYDLVFDLDEEWKAETGTDLWLSAAITSPDFAANNGDFLREFRETTVENRDGLAERGRRDTLRRLAERELKLSTEDAQKVLPVIAQSMKGVGYGTEEQEGVRRILRFIKSNGVIEKIPAPLWWQP